MTQKTKMVVSTCMWLGIPTLALLVGIAVGLHATGDLCWPDEQRACKSEWVSTNQDWAQRIVERDGAVYYERLDKRCRCEAKR